MKTKDLSEEQLLDYFKEHIRYEILMLLNATHAIKMQFQIQEGLKFMILESYAIHLRNLINFFYPPIRIRDTDVCAKDFFIEEATWGTKRPELSATLRKAKDRADKEVSHLTTLRKNANDNDKSWDVKPLTYEIMPVFNLFCKSTDKVELVSLVDDLMNHYSLIKSLAD